MRISRLSLADVGRLKDLDPTPEPDLWAKEAEQFVFGGELAEFVRRYQDDLKIVIGEHEADVEAVGITYPDPRFFATRIGSIVVRYQSRRLGYGLAMLQELVNDAIKSGSVCWLVHPNNKGMLACSRQVEPQPNEASIDDGYIMFIAP